MLRLIRKKAQSTAEYVIVLGLIVAAVMAMQTYIKRGFNGRIKDAVDYKGQTSTANVVTFSTNQYEPYYTDSNFENTRNTEESEDYKTGGSVERKTEFDRSKRTGVTKALAPQND